MPVPLKISLKIIFPEKFSSSTTQLLLDTSFFLAYIINLYSCKLIKIYQTFFQNILKVPDTIAAMRDCQESFQIRYKSFAINNLDSFISNSFALYQMQQYIYP